MRRRQGRSRVIGGALASAILFGLNAGCPPMMPPDDGNGNGNDNGGGGSTGPTRLETASRSSNIALTADHRFLVTANRDADSASVVEVRNAAGADVQNLLAEIGVGDEPHSVAIAPTEKEAYVTNTASGTVTVIALTGDDALTSVADIAVGTEPRGCAITPNGTRLFVANHTAGTLSVIDPAARSVVQTITVGGFPQALAITNDGDADDNDETVFVTQFFAEQIPGGPGETFDTGKQAIVQAFTVGNPATITRIVLAPLTDSGFTADRGKFCQQITAGAANNTFCPDTTIVDATNDVIDADVQAVFPNQLFSALIRNNRVFVPNIGAQPEPPIRFNVNVQALVSVIDIPNLREAAGETLNLNAQIRLEAQPADAIANTVLTRLFGGDMIAADADKDAAVLCFLSRGGNYVMRASLDGTGRLTISAPNVVRLQTGNLPTGLVVSTDGKRCYTNNEVGHSVSALNLENNTVIARDIAVSTPPEPGTFEHGVLVGKLCFFTSLGIPDDGAFSLPIRSIVPLESRGKASDNGWSSCASCHPNGLADGVTWSFATGPRQTVPLDSFFAKDNPHDQRISNWSAVRGGVNDFNENSINVQGGKGFAGTPPNPNIYNHGITQGASDALDAQTLWVQTVRAPILPAASDANAATAGRTVFQNNCASCHGGAKWTKSQVLYLDNPVFNAPPIAGSVARDPGILNAAAQIRSYTVSAMTLTFMETVGTFSAANPLEIRSDGTAALGGLGFNVPSLLGVAYHAPYFHHGAAQTLEQALAQHALGAGTIESTLSATDRTNLLAFLRTIDGATATFRSAADDFRDAISP